MADQCVKEYDGSMEQTLATVKSNILKFQNGMRFIPDQYPLVTSKNWFRSDIKFLNENHVLSEVLSDCVLTPTVATRNKISIPDASPPIQWLTNKPEDDSNDAFTLIRLAANKDKFIMVIPLLDIKAYAASTYKSAIQFVGFAIATPTLAIVVDALTPGLDEFMRHLLSSVQLIKIMLNTSFEAPQLLKAYGVPLQDCFCISTALATMLSSLGLDDLPFSRSEFMPNLKATTGIPMPLINLHQDWKRHELLQFLDAVLANLGFLFKYRHHMDNGLKHYRFGFTWPLAPALECITRYLPLCFGQTFWTRFMATKDTTSSMPYLVATLLYCYHPSLKVLDPKITQCRENEHQVYTFMHQLAYDASQPYSINYPDNDGSEIIKSFVNWIKFERSTYMSMSKYKLITGVLGKLLYHAPTFCSYVDDIHESL